MRLRLLIDIEWTDPEVTRLAEAIADQPVALVSMDGWAPLGGRLMGATPVYEDPSLHERLGQNPMPGVLGS